MSRSGPDPSALHIGLNLDPYRGVVIVLLALALLGTAGALAAGAMFPDPVLLDTAVTLALATGILFGAALAQLARARPPKIREADSQTMPAEPPQAAAEENTPAFPPAAQKPDRSEEDWLVMVRTGTATAGAVAIVFVLPFSFATIIPPTSLMAGLVAAFCLAGAGLAAAAARYLAATDPSRLPEAPGLCRGARVTAWILVVAALSCGLVWAGLQTFLRILEFAVLAINAAVCYGLLRPRQPHGNVPPAFPLDLTVLSVLGTRTNLVASVLDSAEAQLGIDLRSTWALTVVRRSLEPLVIGLCLLAWLSTSLTVVGLDEQGLVERLGVPVGGAPLPPGLHLHWPWPLDRVFRIPVKQVQALAVGHEGEEGKGPENVLWAVEHAANEYTLLLGNGRDLITVDATVQFRIADARAWRYHSQNPAEALKAIAYRAVMRNTVNRTLSEALSENVAILTARMRAMVQSDADALGLGVEVMAFTLGGMHPPVMVASDYQGVVSAELGKVTAMVNAQVFRNQTIPLAQTVVLASLNTARARGAETLAKAAGQAWSFRTLESQFRAAPEEYYFRRRLETLEKGLAMRPFTVVDTRFQRDGGELWLMP
jgi:regulator of protease activity HflC (stomatin/prohibitin superfamily)